MLARSTKDQIHVNKNDEYDGSSIFTLIINNNGNLEIKILISVI